MGTVEEDVTDFHVRSLYGPRTAYAYGEARTLMLHSAGKDALTQQVLRMTALEVLDKGMQLDWDEKMRRRHAQQEGAKVILNTRPRDLIDILSDDRVERFDI